MTIPVKGGAKVPGPLGMFQGRMTGRIPRPLGIGSAVPAGGGTVTPALKTLKMPAPATGKKPYTAHEVVSPLSNDTPKTNHVRQGALATCPIASILAAFAHTASGQRRIQGMVHEHGQPVETDLTGITLESPPNDNKITSKRYFTVTFGGGGAPIEVSDVFYTDDGDRDTWSLIYMGTTRPSSAGAPDALWPSVIEKAYAAKMTTYEELDDYQKHHAEEFWEGLAGSKPTILVINADTGLDKIREVAKAASKVPAIGATPEKATDVLGEHGFAILGMKGSNIELYDPFGRELEMSLEKFRSNFSHILYGNPSP